MGQRGAAATMAEVEVGVAMVVVVVVAVVMHGGQRGDAAAPAGRGRRAAARPPDSRGTPSGHAHGKGDRVRFWDWQCSDWTAPSPTSDCSGGRGQDHAPVQRRRSSQVCRRGRGRGRRRTGRGGRRRRRRWQQRVASASDDWSRHRCPRRRRSHWRHGHWQGHGQGRYGDRGPPGGNGPRSPHRRPRRRRSGADILADGRQYRCWAAGGARGCGSGGDGGAGGGGGSGGGRGGPVEHAHTTSGQRFGQQRAVHAIAALDDHAL